MAAARLQISFFFSNKEHEDGAEYSITAVAANEFGRSEPSAPFVFTTPNASPVQPPDILDIKVQPPADREPYGSLAITILPQHKNLVRGEAALCLRTAPVLLLCTVVATACSALLSVSLSSAGAFVYTLVGTATNEDDEVISTLVFEGAGTELEGGKVTCDATLGPSP